MNRPPRRLRSDGREFVVAVYPSELDAAAAVAGPTGQSIVVALRRLARTRELFENPADAPSVTAIAEACGCDRRTIERNVLELEAAGLVEVIRFRGRGKANRVSVGAETLRIRREARGESPGKIGQFVGPATESAPGKVGQSVGPAPECARSEKTTDCPESTASCPTRPDVDVALNEQLTPEEAEAGRALLSDFRRNGDLDRAARELRGSRLATRGAP